MSQSFSQRIDRVVLTSNMADEPPTSQGPDVYLLEFKRDGSGSFIITDHQINNVRTNLKQSVLIPGSEVDTVTKWLAIGKKFFKLNDFELTNDMLISGATASQYQFTFGIPSDFVVSIDSFLLCQKYRVKKTVSTGGFSINVKLVANSGTETFFRFDSNDIGESKFDLNGYLLSYRILNKRIPDEFPHHDFFSPENLVQILLHYQKTVECEGYYYQEFTKRHPNRSSLENRMMTGWNFGDYMKGRESDSLHCHSQLDSLTNKVVYAVANQMPEPVEGYQRLFDEIGKVKYPHYSNLEGKLIFGFIVQTNGSITGKRVIKGIDNPDWTDQVFEALARLKWKPGKCNGKSVDMIVILPVIVHTK
jgi:hypothetical protein